MNDAASPKVEITRSQFFTQWMAQQKASLAFTTYQAGKLFLLGLDPDDGLSVVERTFDHCMGLAVRKGQFWMSSLYQLWRFENFVDPGKTVNGYDAMFVPVAGHTTGEVDIHDIHIRADGTPVFVNTRFNCLATLSQRGSFKPAWTPPFIDRVVAEDRCHLNGMAVKDDAPRYVSCVSRSNVAEGWRDHRRDGGVVIDVETGEVIASNLSMPHSPRLYQGNFWILQTGTGEFGTIDPGTGDFSPLCFLPGFARGLSFIGDYAVIGLSKPRGNRTFSGLELNERLDRENVNPRCGLCIVNLKTGEIEHHLEINGVVEELYDVAILPGLIRPMVLGFKSEEIRFALRPEIDKMPLPMNRSSGR